MRVRLESIGCRLNIGEVEAISRELAAAGHRVVGPGEPADLCIFNSCAVTGVASRKSRQALRQLRRTLPDANRCTPSLTGRASIRPQFANSPIASPNTWLTLVQYTVFGSL